jgi:hypothetical protein
VRLVGALKKSIAGEASAKGKKSGKPLLGEGGLLPIEGKKVAEKAAKPERSTGRRKAGGKYFLERNISASLQKDNRTS